MAIVANRVLRTNRGSSGSSYATASWTPGATTSGANFWVVVVSTSGGGSPTVSISGNSATWTQQKLMNNSGSASLAIFTSANATSAGALTATIGQSQTDILVHIIEFSGVASSGQVVQVVGTAKPNASQATISGTLAAYGDTVNNLGFAAVGVQVTSDPTITAGTGWFNEGGDFEYGSIECYNSEFTTPGTTTSTQEQTASFSWTGNKSALLVAMEIKAAPAGGGGSSTFAAFFTGRRRH